MLFLNHNKGEIMSENALQSLNLQQKKYIHKHKEDPDFVGYQDKIRSIVGTPIEIEFDWNTVAQGLLTDSFDNMFLNNGNNIKEWFLQNFENGLKMLCADSLSKETFGSKIKKVKFIHDREGSLKINNDTLIFAANLHGNGSPSKESVNEFLNENL